MKARLLIIATLLFSFHGPHSASAGGFGASAVGATWTTKDTSAKTITGSLGPSAISITNISSPSISSAGNDFSGPNYSAAPLSNSGPAISNYEVRSNYTVTFSLPVSGLMIYGMNWRGNGATPYVYTFNHPVEVLSGFDQSSASGNALTISTSFDDGIIRFTEPVKTLTVSMNTSNTGGQIMTFGVVPTTTSLTVAGPIKPFTKKGFYRLSGTASATYGIQAVKVKIGAATAVNAIGTTSWHYSVKLPKVKLGKHPKKRVTRVRIQSIGNDGSMSAAQTILITRQFPKKK